MKKIISLIMVGIMMYTFFGAAVTNNDVVSLDNNNSQNRDYTHTVFVEVATTQWCPPCASWNTNIYNTYNSGNYDFEYVEMIYQDHSGNVLNNQANTWKNLYGISSIPTSIFDGDYQRIVGNLPTQLPTTLNTCGQRAVKNIEASLSIDWLGNATISISLQITNHETTQYNGYIRVPITEITSRYTTNSGTKYHHGFLAYAFPMNTAISLAPGGTYTNSVTWIGSQHQDNQGNNFGDIVANNIKVILGVFSSTDGYVDETVAATMNVPPNTPSNPSPQNEQTNVDLNANLGWTGGDPNSGDTVTYDIYFGTTNPPVKIVSNQSGTSYNPGTMDYLTTYFWKIVAWDNHGASTQGPIWRFTTLINPNNAPTIPQISGPTKGKTGTTYRYTITSTDADGDMMYCYIQWGDDTVTEWTGPFNSGVPFAVTHTWDTKGTYTVQAKVRDIHGAESPWGTLEVRMPTNYATTHPILQWLLERFPSSFPLLRFLIQG